MSADRSKLGSDVLRSSDEIAEFLFGKPGERRKVYLLAALGLPHFQLGSMIYAQRSALMQWAKDRTSASSSEQTDSDLEQSNPKTQHSTLPVVDLLAEESDDDRG